MFSGPGGQLAISQISNMDVYSLESHGSHGLALNCPGLKAWFTSTQSASAPERCTHREALTGTGVRDGKLDFLGAWPPIAQPAAGFLKGCVRFLVSLAGKPG